MKHEILTRAIATKSGFSVKETNTILLALQEHIIEQLATGDSMTLSLL